jgi:hypothetical protein
MERPMPQPNDLSRSLFALEQDATLIAVIEMGQTSWLVAGIVPGIERQPLKKLATDQEGPRFSDAHAVIADAYANDVSDEFVLPAVVGHYRGMRDGDGVLCFNFRADRVREILTALLDPAFSGFPRRRTVRIAVAAGMTQYSEELVDGI